MNKLYKIIFIISFVLSFVIAYSVYEYAFILFEISSNFYVVDNDILSLIVMNSLYFLYLAFYIYDIVLVFKNKDVVIDKKDVSVPIIYVLFSIFTFILSIFASYNFNNLVFSSSYFDMEVFYDYLSVGYYILFLVIPCLINLIWAFIIFRKKKSKKDVK